MSFADRYIASSGIDSPVINLRTEVKKDWVPDRGSHYAQQNRKGT